MSLYEELTAGPLAEAIAPHIVSGNDGAIADIMNAANIAKLDSVARAKFAKWSRQAGIWSIDDEIDAAGDPYGDRIQQQAAGI